MRTLSAVSKLDVSKPKMQTEELPKKKEMPVPSAPPVAAEKSAVKNDVSSLEKKGLKRLPKPNFSEAEVWNKIREFEAEKGGGSSLLKGPAANTKGKLKNLIKAGGFHFSEKERETFSKILKN